MRMFQCLPQLFVRVHTERIKIGTDGAGEQNLKEEKLWETFVFEVNKTYRVLWNDGEFGS